MVTWILIWTYSLGSADLGNLTITLSQGSLATNHVSAVRKHGHANERVAVGVPVDNGALVFPVHASSSLLLDIGECASLLLFASDRQVHVSDFKVHRRHKVNTSNLGDDGEGLGVLPGIVHERSATLWRNQALASTGLQGRWIPTWQDKGYSLRSEASQLALCKVTRVLVLGLDFLAQDLLPHLLDGLFGEQRERLRNTNVRNTTAVRVTELVHRVHLRGRSVLQVLGRVEGNLRGLRDGRLGGSLRAVELEACHGGGGHGLCGRHGSTLI